MNRIIEMATPRIFDLNQRVINYAINNLIVPRINRILTMFSVVTPKTKVGTDTGIALNDDDFIVYAQELDDKTIVEYLRKYPIPINDNVKFIDMIFNEDCLSKRKGSGR